MKKDNQNFCHVTLNFPNKQSESDPIPTWLLKKCALVLVPTITNIVNLSLSSGQFHPTLKQSTISPLLKKLNLDKDAQTIVLFLIFLSYLKSLNMLLNLDLLNTLLPIIFLIPTSLLTFSTTPLKLLCSTFTIILLML